MNCCEEPSATSPKLTGQVGAAPHAESPDSYWRVQATEPSPKVPSPKPGDSYMVPFQSQYHGREAYHRYICEELAKGWYVRMGMAAGPPPAEIPWWCDPDPRLLQGLSVMTLEEFEVKVRTRVVPYPPAAESAQGAQEADAAGDGTEEVRSTPLNPSSDGKEAVEGIEPVEETPRKDPYEEIPATQPSPQEPRKTMPDDRPLEDRTPPLVTRKAQLNGDEVEGAEAVVEDQDEPVDGGESSGEHNPDENNADRFPEPKRKPKAAAKAKATAAKAAAKATAAKAKATAKAKGKAHAKSSPKAKAKEAAKPKAQLPDKPKSKKDVPPQDEPPKKKPRQVAANGMEEEGEASHKGKTFAGRYIPKDGDQRARLIAMRDVYMAEIAAQLKAQSRHQESMTHLICGCA